MMTILYISLISLIAIIALYLYMLMPRLKKHPVLIKSKDQAYAHRGLHDKENGVPENSLRAFKLAMQHGYGIELDVHLSKDENLVVMHDESLKRIVGADMNIFELTKELIDEYCLDNTNQKIPYLNEVLELVAGKVPLLIELKPAKNNYAKLCEATFKLLDGYNGDFMVQSFDPRVIRWMKYNRPKTARGQLSGYLNKHGDSLHPFLDFMLRNLLMNFLTRPDFIAYNFCDRNAISLRICKKLFGVVEFNWTITSKDQQKVCESDNSIIIFEQFLPIIKNSKK